MKCEICKENEATIHLTEIIDGQRSEMHLCEQCASQQGVIIKSQMPINELLSNLLSSQPTDEDLFGHDSKNRVCPDCGFTIEKFKEQAVLGCPNDYKIFEKALSPLIKKAHNGKTVHCGKVPSKTPDNEKTKIELMNLQQQLQFAVQNEKYELAAELRDKIAEKEKSDNEAVNNETN